MLPRIHLTFDELKDFIFEDFNLISMFLNFEHNFKKIKFSRIFEFLKMLVENIN